MIISVSDKHINVENLSRAIDLYSDIWELSVKKKESKALCIFLRDIKSHTEHILGSNVFSNKFPSLNNLAVKHSISPINIFTELLQLIDEKILSNSLIKRFLKKAHFRSPISKKFFGLSYLNIFKNILEEGIKFHSEISKKLQHSNRIIQKTTIDDLVISYGNQIAKVEPEVIPMESSDFRLLSKQGALKFCQESLKTPGAFIEVNIGGLKYRLSQDCQFGFIDYLNDKGAHSIQPISISFFGLLIPNFSKRQGSYGRIFYAYDALTRKKVVIKLSRTSEKSNKLVGDLLKESYIQQYLNKKSTHLLGAARVGLYNDITILIMKPMLNEYISKISNLSDLRQIIPFLRDAAKGLEALHQERIIHGDICLNNILYCSKTGANLSDFGESIQLKKGQEVAYKKKFLFTCTYVAPEVISLHPHMELKSDIYSFGVLIYKSLENRSPPLVGSVSKAHLIDWEKFQHRHGEAVASLVKKCMSLNPKERPRAQQVRLFFDDFIHNRLHLKYDNKDNFFFPIDNKCIKVIPDITKKDIFEEYTIETFSRKQLSLHISTQDKQYIVQSMGYLKDRNLYVGVRDHSRTFIGTECSSNREVAIRITNSEAIKAQTEKEQLMEIQILKTLHKLNNRSKHLNIPFQIGRTQNETLLFLNPFSEGNLNNSILDNKINSEEKIIEILRDASIGLEVLHSNNVIHNDIKLSNVLWDYKRGGALTDFSHSLEIPDNKNQWVYQETYVNHDGRTAPEKFLCEAGFKSDIFSFGCMLYEVLEKDFIPNMCDIPSLDLIKWDVFQKKHGKSLANLTKKCLSHSPDKRPHAKKLREALESIVQNNLHQE